MIDFRYHLVSLISVFLALAVGIVLGAGPLQNSLGTALNDQVTSLRESRNTLNSQLEQTASALNERDTYITQVARSLLPGTLSGQTVAVVMLPGAEEDDADQIVAQLQAAGAAADGRYALTETWVERSRESYRSTYSEQFTDLLADPASSAPNAVMGEGVGKALTGDDGSARALENLLTAGEDPLMTTEAEPSGPADMVVVVGPRAQPSSGGPSGTATPQATDGTEPGSWVPVMTGAGSAATTVVVGSADESTGVVALIRSDDAAVTTVDSVGQAPAAVSTPLALVATEAGTVGHYGFDQGATAVMPPVPG
ncbi:copper transporter [Actinomyces sp. 2119]|uniref:copper transporter n=2 Tax=Actinomyces TaxID=1654 RepID=UPI000E6D3A61|nr:copper transporter [Actinomyces sp. 2119]RJF44636.1 copper transporter [Actinomyces sp. 2119]